DWLLDHRAEFQLLVMERLGYEEAEDISWENTRLVCIAGDFTRYDLYAVEQINRNIELIRYKRYGDELLLLELVNVTAAAEPEPSTTSKAPSVGSSPTYPQKLTPGQVLDKADQELRDLYDELKTFALSLGDDVQIKSLKMYIAFRRIKNFMC